MYDTSFCLIYCFRLCLGENDVFGCGHNIDGVNVPACGLNTDESTAGVTCRTFLIRRYNNGSIARNVSFKVPTTYNS